MNDRERLRCLHQPRWIATMGGCALSMCMGSSGWFDRSYAEEVVTAHPAAKVVLTAESHTPPVLTAPDPAGHPTAATRSEPPRHVPTVEQLQDWERQRAAKLSGLQQRMKLLAKQRAAQAAAHDVPVEAPASHVATEVAHPTDVHVPAPSASDHGHEHAAAPVPTQVDPAHDAHATHDADASHATNVEGPIDRIGLADSLYAVGDLRAAECVYRSIATETLNAEQEAWVTFQLAGCDRRQGRIEAAQQKYRELVAQTEPAWLVELARWWLTELDDRARLAGNAAKLTQLLQQLDTEVTREVQIDPRMLPDQATGGTP